jgi:hypothetical protein
MHCRCSTTKSYHWGGNQNGTTRLQDGGCRFLLSRTTKPTSRRFNCYVKQPANALWMQDRFRDLPQDVLQLLANGAWHFIPAKVGYQRFSFLAMHTWMKMLWEKLDKFDIVVQTTTSSFQFPWQGDKFLMLVFMDRGHSREALIQLNWVRLNQQIIFLSDILLDLGLRIDPTVLWHLDPSAKHSTKKWPKEEPTESNIELWQEAVEDICPSWRRVHSVGEYVTETIQIHAWQLCPDSKNLLHSAASSATMEVYSNTTRKFNCYTKTSTCPQEERGAICSVDEIQPSVFCVTSTVRRAPTAPISNSFLVLLHKWGCTWLWEHMQVEGGMEWILEAIQDGSLVAVTDGSYIRQLYPNLCLAAFVLECAEGMEKSLDPFQNLHWQPTRTEENSLV